MGTTLTGTTPQDTYDSLIKVTNNGPLSSTARYLSDGLGNDSVLALSTSRVGIGTASPDLTLHLYNSAAALAYFESTSGNGAYVIWRNSGTSIGDVGSQLGISGSGSASNFMIASRSGDMILGSSSAERMRITSTGNVGIGTSSPAGNLHISSASDTGIRIQAGASNLSYIDLADTASGTPAGSIAYNHIVNAITFATGTNVERARIDSDGLKFNGDTAAANALDDYEEGTWTMGISFGGASVGVTYLFQEASYTKIGRQVTATGVIVLSSKGSSSGNVAITGLPFTIPNSLNRFCAATLRCIGVSFANQFQGEGVINSTTVELNETTEAGVGSALTEADIANNANIALTITYFV